MICPNCKTENLVTSESHTIQIDHCPRCRGVWLDRGELEKLIQMSSGEDDRQAESVNGREYGEDEEVRSKRSSGEDREENDDDDSSQRERTGTYRSRESDDDDDASNERGGTYRSREKDDDSGANERGGTYRNRENYEGQRGGPTQQEGGRSIWRDIFDNLGEKLPRI